MLLGASVAAAVEESIVDYSDSTLRTLVDESGVDPLGIKFVSGQWASHYATNRPLKISETPALTWGTGTYVTPIAFPLSSVLYGRVGLVSSFDPTTWRVFDSTTAAARAAYINWVRAQANFEDLVLSVHSTFANHKLRDKFRRDFQIDCVLFHPDQEAELHTDTGRDVWMLVTDWLPNGEIDTRLSARFARARFTVLIDEEFDLADAGLPIRVAARKIETTTRRFPLNACLPVSRARVDPALGVAIAGQYWNNGYLHIYVEP